MGEERRQDAARLIGILKKTPGHRAPAPVIIHCGKPGDEVAPGLVVAECANASASLPGTTGFPNILVNLESQSHFGPAEIHEVLFHESLHWLGYRHGEGTDITYLVSKCCMAAPEVFAADVREQACDLLKKAPAWTSMDYQIPFMRMMRMDTRTPIAASSAWESVFASPAPHLGG